LLPAGVGLRTKMMIAMVQAPMWRLTRFVVLVGWSDVASGR
jgi:hypothetical protein